MGREAVGKRLLTACWERGFNLGLQLRAIARISHRSAYRYGPSCWLGLGYSATGDLFEQQAMITGLASRLSEATSLIANATHEISELRSRPMPASGPGSQGNESPTLAMMQLEVTRAKQQIAALDGSQQRLESVKAALLKQADEITDNEYKYLVHMGDMWPHATKHILDSIAPGASYRFAFGGSSFPEIRRAVMSLRAIAADLRVSDLRQ